MKKIIIGLMLVSMMLMLTACSPKVKDVDVAEKELNETESNTDVVLEDEAVTNEDSEDEIYEGMGLANPWVDSDKAGVLEATGFNLVAPEDAFNVAYSYMPDEGMAQLNFTMNNAMWVYRAKPTEELEDISGIYCEWNYIGETKVAGMDAMEYGYSGEQEGEFIDDIEGTRVVNWYDAQNKVTYSLSVIGIDLNGLDTPVFAENLFKMR